MKKLVVLIALAIVLAGCGDDSNGGDSTDGGDSGGDYGTYWGVTEAISRHGYVPEMTQVPEPLGHSTLSELP